MEDRFIYVTDSNGTLAVNVDNIITYRDCKHPDMQTGFRGDILIGTHNFLVKESAREITNLIRNK